MTAATADWLTTDFYAVLGVPPTASAKDITRAYRKLARQLHPDTRTGGGGDDRFKEVTAAYEVLGDDAKRREYDQLRAAARARPPRAGGGRGPVRVTVQQPGTVGPTEFVDLDGEDVLGGFGLHDLFGGGAARGARRPRRGADLTATLRLGFEQAVRGATLDLPLTETVVCDACSGSGTGLRDVRPCPHCQGTGAQQRTRVIAARIPPGVQDGQTIRLAGKGDPGSGGGPAGDLLIEVSVDPHPVLGRDGRNLSVQVPVTFAEAALGADVPVPTLDGPVTVRVPAGTGSGTTLRVRGRGVPAGGGTPAGDLLVTVQVDVPKRLTDAQRRALEQLAATLPPPPGRAAA